MRTIDPIAYLRSVPPFDALPQALFDEAVAGMDIAFYGAGTVLVRAGDEPLKHLYVIRTGAARLERAGQTLQVLERGETFGYTSLITRRATIDVVVEEDLLVYRVPDTQFQRLLTDATFARHFAGGLAERLKASLTRSPVATFDADLSQEIGQLIRRPPAWIDAGATVGQAARRMRVERISSLLVSTEPPGIVTDRDFRARVLAEGRGPDTPVVEVYTQPLRSIRADLPLFEAWTFLLEAGVHHVGIEREGRIVGVLTSTDLLKCSAAGPVSVLRSVERLSDRGSLAGFSARVAEMASALLAGGLDTNTIAGFVARLGDTLLRRILQWAEAEQGPPPAPYAFLELGSGGRMEQTLLTDQDNALVWADEASANLDWYRRLAERVGTDLEAAGYPRCPGGRMARRWNGTVSHWVAQIRESIEERPHDAGVFFDLRRAGGALDIAPLEAELASARRHRLFLRVLARSALSLPSPSHFVLLGSDRVDLKQEGIAPVVLLARCYAIEVGSAARNTFERLDAAKSAGLMGEAVHADVTEAYHFLLGLRLRAQLRSTAAREQVTDEVLVSDLSPLERNRLKDSLRAIRRWRDKAAYHYQTALL